MLTPADLSTEAQLTIGAGSDTTATALTNIMYYLIKHPSTFARLRAELDAASGDPTMYDQSIESGKLAELKFLQAVVNEILRLQPAIPHDGQRICPGDKGVILLGQ